MNHITIHSLYEKAKALADALEMLSQAERGTISQLEKARFLMGEFPYAVADMDMPEDLKTCLLNSGIRNEVTLKVVSLDYLIITEGWSLQQIRALDDWMRSKGLKLREREND